MYEGKNRLVILLLNAHFPLWYTGLMVILEVFGDNGPENCAHSDTFLVFVFISSDFIPLK